MFKTTLGAAMLIGAQASLENIQLFDGMDLMIEDMFDQGIEWIRNF
jgi:hypothetical protein